jgi:6-phosphogluconolactonase
MNYYNFIHTNIEKLINFTIKQNNNCSVMLTGGNTAQKLYEFWSKQAYWEHKNISFYFGDERCVPPYDPESNYGMAFSSLFSGRLPHDFVVERIIGETADCDFEAKRYASLLPKTIDVLLLSVGEDGHIASLFPHSPELNEYDRLLVPVVSPKLPKKRITITPKVIRGARNIVVIARGETKGGVIARALSDPENVEELPVCLAVGENTTWILDQQASKILRFSFAGRPYKARVLICE